MNVTTAPKSAEANDILTAQADERLAHAYEQIARADDQLARLTEQLTRMEQDARPSAVLRRRRSRGRPALRALVGLLIAGSIAGFAFVSQSSYGEAVRPTIAHWVEPYLGPVAWATSSKPEVTAQPAPSSVRLASAEPASPQAPPSAQAGPQDAASPAAAPTTADLVQLLQTVARDLTTLQQGIEQLKAGQEQLASDNAKAVEQFRASQEQMTRLTARIAEQEQRVATRTAAPQPKPVAEPARKPVPASSQARAQPLQLQPAPR